MVGRTAPTVGELERILVRRGAFPADAAGPAACELAEMLEGGGPWSVALATWLIDAELNPVVGDGRTDTAELTREGLGYPAALLYLKWANLSKGQAER